MKAHFLPTTKKYCFIIIYDMKIAFFKERRSHCNSFMSESAHCRSSLTLKLLEAWHQKITSLPNKEIYYFTIFFALEMNIDLTAK